MSPHRKIVLQIDPLWLEGITTSETSSPPLKKSQMQTKHIIKYIDIPIDRHLSSQVLKKPSIKCFFFALHYLYRNLSNLFKIAFDHRICISLKKKKSKCLIMDHQAYVIRLLLTLSDVLFPSHLLPSNHSFYVRILAFAVSLHGTLFSPDLCLANSFPLFLKL